MAQTALIQIRVDEEVKRKADILFQTLVLIPQLH